jgi:trans-aconitate 2-methyltransferase
VVPRGRRRIDRDLAWRRVGVDAGFAGSYTWNVPDAWKPDQYERFQKERSQPFYDLLALVRPSKTPRVIDLGCGTGTLTLELHQRLGAARTLGVDGSEAMLARTTPIASPPALTFERADIATLASAWSRDPKGRFDVVFSNAALHWLPSHEQLLSQITSAIAPKGQLAVQVPANHDHPTHTIAATLAAEAEFRGPLAGHSGRTHVLLPEEYAMLLNGLGYTEQHVRLVVYTHVLPARDEVLEWVKGTLLTYYETRLPPPLFKEFLARYKKLLFKVLPDQRPFLYPFKRILFWGARP